MAGIDRLRDLGLSSDDALSPTADREAQAAQRDMADSMQPYEPISEGLNKIADNVEVVKKLKFKDKTSATKKDRDEIMKELESVTATTTNLARKIKQLLEKIKSENIKFSEKKENKNSAKAQMRENLYQTHIRRFHKIMNDYNTATHDFKQGHQDRTKREVKYVMPELPETKVNELVESGNAQNIIEQALLSENLYEIVRNIEARHLEILRLESQVMEVFELFKDLATLVDLQQESLDVIDARIQSAHNYATRAEADLKDAKKSQSKARKCQCILFGILLIIVIVILAIFFSGTFSSS